MNKLFENKAPGFRAALVLLTVNILALIVYPVSFRSSLYMSWLLFVILLASAAAGICLLFTGKMELYPWIGVAAGIIGLAVFVHSNFNYIVDAYVGIDVTSLSAPFVISLVLLIAMYVIAFVANLMSFRKA